MPNKPKSSEDELAAERAILTAIADVAYDFMEADSPVQLRHVFYVVIDSLRAMNDDLAEPIKYWKVRNPDWRNKL